MNEDLKAIFTRVLVIIYFVIYDTHSILNMLFYCINVQYEVFPLTLQRNPSFDFVLFVNNGRIMAMVTLNIKELFCIFWTKLPNSLRVCVYPYCPYLTFVLNVVTCLFLYLSSKVGKYEYKLLLLLNMCIFGLFRVRNSILCNSYIMIPYNVSVK